MRNGVDRQNRHKYESVQISQVRAMYDHCTKSWEFIDSQFKRDFKALNSSSTAHMPNHLCSVHEHNIPVPYASMLQTLWHKMKQPNVHTPYTYVFKQSSV